MPADGPLAPSTGFPARLRPVPNRPSVTRDPRDTEGPTTDQSHRPKGVLAPHAHAHPLPFPRGRRRGHRRVLVDPSRRHPTPLRESQEEEEEEVAAAPLLPHISEASISREPLARRRPRDSGDDRSTVAGLPELQLGDRGHMPPLADIAHAPAGRRYIKAAARWLQTTAAKDTEADPDPRAVKSRGPPPGRPISSGPTSEGRAAPGHQPRELPAGTARLRH